MGKPPEFRIRKKLFSGAVHVVIVNGIFRSTKVARFRSEFDAQYWIRTRGIAWLEKHKRAAETQG